MPTPADIKAIIDPPKPERKLCDHVYRQLCKQRSEGQFMSTDELNYIAEYENAGVKGNLDNGDIKPVEDNLIPQGMID